MMADDPSLIGIKIYRLVGKNMQGETIEKYSGNQEKLNACITDRSTPFFNGCIYNGLAEHCETIMLSIFMLDEKRDFHFDGNTIYNHYREYAWVRENAGAKISYQDQAAKDANECWRIEVANKNV